MTWPIPTLPTNWTNVSPQLNSHPDAHNALADAINELYARQPRGWIGQASPSSDQSGIGGTATDIAGMSVSWTADPTRRYKTSLVLTCYPSATASVVVQIANAANTMLRREFANAAVANAYINMSCFTVESGLSGAQTRKAQIWTSAGTLVVHSATTAAMILVEDIGKV